MRKITTNSPLEVAVKVRFIYALCLSPVKVYAMRCKSTGHPLDGRTITVAWIMISIARICWIWSLY